MICPCPQKLKGLIICNKRDCPVDLPPLKLKKRKPKEVAENVLC